MPDTCHAVFHFVVHYRPPPRLTTAVLESRPTHLVPCSLATTLLATAHLSGTTSHRFLYRLCPLGPLPSLPSPRLTPRWLTAGLTPCPAHARPQATSLLAVAPLPLYGTRRCLAVCYCTSRPALTASSCLCFPTQANALLARARQLYAFAKAYPGA